MRKTLLLVEDNRDMLDVLVESFKEDYEVVTAMDGAEALRKVDEALPALIVLDIMLPTIDGFQVCEIIRKNPRTAGIPILLLTGLPGELTRLTALDSGGTDFMTKPCEPSKLGDRVRSMLVGK
jgi:DNA-binding response OmpR family regulator